MEKSELQLSVENFTFHAVESVPGMYIVSPKNNPKIGILIWDDSERGSGKGLTFRTKAAPFPMRTRCVCGCCDQDTGPVPAIRKACKNHNIETLYFQCFEYVALQDEDGLHLEMGGLARVLPVTLPACPAKLILSDVG